MFVKWNICTWIKLVNLQNESPTLTSSNIPKTGEQMTYKLKSWSHKLHNLIILLIAVSLLNHFNFQLLSCGLSLTFQQHVVPTSGCKTYKLLCRKSLLFFMVDLLAQLNKKFVGVDLIPSISFREQMEQCMFHCNWKTVDSFFFGPFLMEEKHWGIFFGKNLSLEFLLEKIYLRNNIQQQYPQLGGSSQDL